MSAFHLKLPRHHLHNDVGVPDEDGVELPDLEVARAYAVRRARIEDERGRVLNIVHFRDTVKVEA